MVACTALAHLWQDSLGSLGWSLQVQPMQLVGPWRAQHLRCPEQVWAGVWGPQHSRLFHLELRPSAGQVMTMAAPTLKVLSAARVMTVRVAAYECSWDTRGYHSPLGRILSCQWHSA